MTGCCKTILVLLVSGLLAACESSPKLEEDIAPVEDRSYSSSDATSDARREESQATQATANPSRQADDEVIAYAEPETLVPPLQELKPAESPKASATTAGRQYKTGPAASSLVNQAGDLARQGKPDQAVAMIERAMRIEPSNPWLWHRLAVLRLQQKQYAKSIELARKSNTLAIGDNHLQAGNWQVISRASLATGDKKTAAKAREEVRRLGGR